MDKTEQPELRDQRREHFDDEVQLIDYLRVIWKWKWLIILGTFVCMIVAGVVSLNMPKIYGVSMAIEPGIIGVGRDGRFLYTNLLNNMERKIKGGIYNRRIQKALNINPLETGIKFETSIQRGTSLIKVTSEWEENEVELGLKALKQLTALLSEDYEKIVKQRRGDYEKRILMKQNQIKKIKTQRKDIDKQILIKKNQIKKIKTQRKDIDKQILIKLNEIERRKNNKKLNEANLKIIRERQKELLQEIKNVKDNTEKIVQQRNTVLQHKGNVDDISLLLYSTTIQQNVAYFNQLSNQINDLRKQENKLEADIEKLDKDIININTEIERTQLKRTEVLQAKIDDVNIEIERINLESTEGLQAKINDLKVEIDRLNLEKGIIECIKVIQNPEVSLSPIKPKKRLNVLLAGVVAFMMMMFLTFFLEYIRKTKNNNIIK